MRRIVLAAALLSLLAGCRDERRCREELTNAQSVVTGIDSKSIDSLKNAVTVLEGAVAACDKAKLGDERSKLLEAKNQIGAQLALLERRAAKKRGPTLTAAELEQVQKDGDPSCPKGQAYRHAGVDKEIRCTGPQLVDMGMDAVKAYFTARNYTLTVTDAPARVRAELGAELFVFTFDKPGDAAGAKCLELYPAPGIPWREAVGRAVGGRMERLKAGGTVSAKRGDLTLAVEDTEQKQLVKIGDCAG